jgi:hypothetical protein
MTFDKIVEKIAEREKAFGKKESLPNVETMCLAQQGYNFNDQSVRHDTSNKYCGKK